MCFIWNNMVSSPAHHPVSSLDASLWWEIYMVREANLGGSSSVCLKRVQPAWNTAKARLRS